MVVELLSKIEVYYLCQNSKRYMKIISSVIRSMINLIHHKNTCVSNLCSATCCTILIADKLAKLNFSFCTISIRKYKISIGNFDLPLLRVYQLWTMHKYTTLYLWISIVSSANYKYNIYKFTKYTKLKNNLKLISDQNINLDKWNHINIKLNSAQFSFSSLSLIPFPSIQDVMISSGTLHSRYVFVINCQIFKVCA